MLTVTVFSFSYRKGIPEDPTGNGGGFVFDCRALHNPGRYDEYKDLCGLDAPVKDFLEREGEVFSILDSAKNLVGQSVECYLRRGFEHLLVSFGCTGGQHRSVYCAQSLGEYIHARYPEVEVVVVHREQKKMQKM